MSNSKTFYFLVILIFIEVAIVDQFKPANDDIRITMRKSQTQELLNFQLTILNQ